MTADSLVISVAVGASAQTRTWKNKQYTWADFVAQLSKSTQTRETLKEFLAMNKRDQGGVKDVGGYVGGYLREGKRNPQNVVYRQLLTLDIDFAATDFFEVFCLLYGCAAVIHATHKHSPSEPRYRLIIPLDREVTPDEYQAIGRRVAGTCGIDMFDNTTFEVNRLMFWPSHPKDVTYYFEEQKGYPLSADEILASYQDWRDTSLWPTADKRLREIGEKAAKQENPLEKKGVVGAFCRTFSIQEAIETYLPDEYTPGTDDRYTYAKGSTANGVVVYDSIFAFSHHGTDPISGKLVNAFDLVRIHRFGYMDDRENSLKSFRAMEELAMKAPEVKRTLAIESLEAAKEAFEGLEVTEEAVDWMAALEIDSKGGYLSSAYNITLIMQHDAKIGSAFQYNEFDRRRYVNRSMPWRLIDSPEPMRDVDFSGTRNYIERLYGIGASGKIDDAMALEAERNRFHPIRDYLTALQWDGQQRIDMLLIDFFGAEDNQYTRAVIRKWMVAAVARIMQPGTKFDNLPILVDPKQGSYKSTFVKVMAKDKWYSESFSTVEGTAAYEQLVGSWLVEVPEMSAIRKADADAAKQFFSKQKDTYRPAYGRVTEDYLRQCVFFGNTNNVECLKDPTGNRRYWPVDVRREHIRKSVVDDLPDMVDQLWAEAVHLYKNGETLYLNEEENALAESEQLNHSERDDRTGIILDYLDRPLPADWEEKDTFERRQFITGGTVDQQGTKRQYVCTAEILVECFGHNGQIKRHESREINDIMRSLPGWRSHSNTTRSFPKYGTQKYYERIS